jgi:DNA processing protein
MSPTDLPQQAYAAALAGLPGMGPSRLTAVLADQPPADAWARVCNGDLPLGPGLAQALGPRATDLLAAWRLTATHQDVAAIWGSLTATNVHVVVRGTPAYPSLLAHDIEPPAVLFHRGPLACITSPRVAIVGTRRSSRTGTGVAFELGRDLTAAGVAVVSGLAAGIDGAAHRGALAALAAADDDGSTARCGAGSGAWTGRLAGHVLAAAGAAGGLLPDDEAPQVAGPAPAPTSPSRAAAGAPPVGVVGSGLDVVYPRSNTDLWQAVGEVGVLLSEAPPGARPERWRFPARNRIIAALADLVVVVESHRRGGSMHTVDEADRRGVDVLAVPGSVRNPAAGGTNDLLAEGRTPVCCADDVLLALGLDTARRRTGAGPPDPRPRPAPDDEAVLEAVGWQPATLDQLVLHTGLDLARLAPAIDRLCDTRWMVRRGGWYERVAVAEQPA